jgi:hypothetical protein
MLRRLKAFFSFENLCQGCELYCEMLAAMGWLELYNLKRDRLER